MHPHELKRSKRCGRRRFWHGRLIPGELMVCRYQIFEAEYPANGRQRIEMLYMRNRVPIGEGYPVKWSAIHTKLPVADGLRDHVKRTGPRTLGSSHDAQFENMFELRLGLAGLLGS